MAGKSALTTALSIIFSVLQLAFALVVGVVTGTKLLDVDRTGIEFDTNCLLDGSKGSGFLTGTQFCVYAILVAIISVVATWIFGCIRHCFKCITFNACGASKLLDVVGNTILLVWWIVAFVLFFQRGRAANDLGWPEKQSRDWVIAASFGAAAAFLGDIIVSIVQLVSK